MDKQAFVNLLDGYEAHLMVKPPAGCHHCNPEGHHARLDHMKKSDEFWFSLIEAAQVLGLDRKRADGFRSVLSDFRNQIGQMPEGHSRRAVNRKAVLDFLGL